MLDSPGSSTKLDLHKAIFTLGIRYAQVTKIIPRLPISCCAENPLQEYASICPFSLRLSPSITQTNTFFTPLAPLYSLPDQNACVSILTWVVTTSPTVVCSLLSDLTGIKETVYR